MLQDSEIILTSDHKVYHLHLSKKDVADTVLLVGDPQRVKLITENFDSLEPAIHNREFHTQTGYYKGTRITVIGTGIGTDNMEIVLNELDAAVNIDLQDRKPQPEKKSLRIIRIGTCGAIQDDIPVGSIICSSHGIGFDGLLNFYADAPSVCEDNITQAFLKHCAWPHRLPFPYCAQADSDLFAKFAANCLSGMTATTPGFYAPQGRAIRLKPELQELLPQLSTFNFQGNRIVNFEMETSALYGLGKMLGHRCLTLCTVVANRNRREFLEDYQSAVKRLIHLTLEQIIELT